MHDFIKKWPFIWRKKNVVAVIGSLLLISILIPHSAPVYAEKHWGKQFISDSNKVWTITFSDPLHEKSAKSNSFFVLDSKGRKVAVQVTISADRKSATVSPQSPYKSGVEYTLVIKKSTRSEDNRILKEQISMPFEMSGSANGKGGSNSSSSKSGSTTVGKQNASPLKISINRKSYLSVVTVKADASVKKVSVDGRDMQYKGDHTFELAVAAVNKGDTLRINASGFNGRTVASENFKVE